MDWVRYSRGFVRHFLLIAGVSTGLLGLAAQAALPKPRGNPLLKKKINLDQIKPKHFQPVWEYLESVYQDEIKEYEAKIQNLTANSQGRDFPLKDALKDFVLITRLENDLDHIYQIFSWYLYGNRSPEILAVNQFLNGRLPILESSVLQNETFYSLLNSLYKRVNQIPNEADRRLVKSYQKKFENGGIHLSETDQFTLTKLKISLEQAKSAYRQNSPNGPNGGLSAQEHRITLTESELAGVPERVLENLKKPNDMGGSIYILTPAGTDFQAVMEYVNQEATRKKIWEASNKVGNVGSNNNLAKGKEILEISQKIAHLLGYDSAAHQVLNPDSDRLVRSIDELKTFYDQIIPPYMEAAEQDQREFLLSYPEAKDKPWNAPYYSRIQLEEKFKIDPEALRTYFEWNHVHQGALTKFGELYGLRFVASQPSERVTQDPKIFQYEAYDVSTGKHLASLVLDPEKREGKIDHVWKNTISTPFGKKRKSYPHIITISMSIPKPEPGKPLLMSFNGRLDSVVSFVHELGHGLEGIVTKAKHSSQTGVHMPIDFIEFSSQLAENFLFTKDFLKKISSHSTTGESLSDEWMDALIAAQSFKSRKEKRKHFIYGLLDLHWYGAFGNPDLSVWESAENLLRYENEILSRLSIDGGDVLHIAISTQFTPSFAGIYNVGYNGYLIGQTYDAAVFQEFLNSPQGPWNPSMGTRLRRQVMQHAASQDPIPNIEKFIGAKVSIKPLLERDKIDCIDLVWLH